MHTSLSTAISLTATVGRVQILNALTIGEPLDPHWTKTPMFGRSSFSTVSKIGKYIGQTLCAALATNDGLIGSIELHNASLIFSAQSVIQVVKKARTAPFIYCLIHHRMLNSVAPQLSLAVVLLQDVNKLRRK